MIFNSAVVKKILLTVPLELLSFVSLLLACTWKLTEIWVVSPELQITYWYCNG